MMGGYQDRPDYYGPSGQGIAQAFEQNYQRKRQANIDAADLASKTEATRHAQAMDPIEEALEGNKAVQAGITPPAGAAGTNGDRLPPIQMGNDHALVPPSGATGTVEGTAHALPGAYNPVTNTHNPADVNLGGGFVLSGDQTPDAKRRRDAGELMNAHIPGMTPELAMYLADHPDRMGDFVGRGSTPGEWHPTDEASAVRYYHETHPHAGENETGGRGPGHLTMEQAFQQVDELYGSKDPVSGAMSSDLSPDARQRLAEQLYEGKGGLPRSKRFGTNPVGGGMGGGTSPGPTSKRHITKDQADYLKHQGKFDPSQYIVDDDED